MALVSWEEWKGRLAALTSAQNAPLMVAARLRQPTRVDAPSHHHRMVCDFPHRGLKQTQCHVYIKFPHLTLPMMVSIPLSVYVLAAACLTAVIMARSQSSRVFNTPSTQDS